MARRSHYDALLDEVDEEYETEVDEYDCEDSEPDTSDDLEDLGCEELLNTSSGKGKSVSSRVKDKDRINTSYYDEHYIGTVLGDISNKLGKVMKRLERTEPKVDQMESKLQGSLSSSGSEPTSRKRSISKVVRVCNLPCQKTGIL